MLQMQEMATRQREKEKMDYNRTREAWDRRRKELENDIARLQDELKHRGEKIEDMKRKQKVQYSARQITGA